MPLVLASGSPRRRELLAQAGFAFEVVPSLAEETPVKVRALAENWPAERLVQQLALEKAREVSRRMPGRVVLGADTVVVLEQTILGKPRDLADAESMLRRLSGRTHKVLTGVALCENGREECAFAETVVLFRKLTYAQIASYFAKVNPLDKAGGYAIQHHGEDVVQRVEGSFSNVVGLPMERVTAMLNQWYCLPGV